MGLHVTKILSWNWRAKRSHIHANLIRDLMEPKDSPNNTRAEIMGASLFRRMLCLERKRAERSRKGFLLMLIDARRIDVPDSRRQVLRKTRAALTSAIRVTDICWWYEEDMALGAIFTEIGAGGSAIMTSIRTKVLESIQGNLDSRYLSKLHLSFHLFPEDWEKKDPRCPVEPLLYPDLFQEEDSRSFYRFAKRTMDILISVIALVALSPLLIFISLAVKLTSKGSVLFKQQRVGQFGVVFTCMKFRSMELVNDPGIHREYMERFISGDVNAGESRNIEKPFYKIQRDQRVTRVGAILRKSSLDELPQFLNVLKGEMSVVGPRPPIPYEVERYDVWHRRRVSEAKPGITGLWQVKGRSRVTFDDSVRLDLKYIDTRSIWLDIKIIFQTPWAILAGEGAS